MKLAIVAYPNLDEVDRQWIELFRTKHDPQASRLGVHFTLVFPVVAMPSELEPEIALVAKSTQPISFTIRDTRAFDPKGRLAPILKRRAELGPYAVVFGTPEGEFQDSFKTAWESLTLVAQSEHPTVSSAPPCRRRSAPPFLRVTNV